MGFSELSSPSLRARETQLLFSPLSNTINSGSLIRIDPRVDFSLKLFHPDTNHSLSFKNSKSDLHSFTKSQNLKDSKKFPQFLRPFNRGGGGIVRDQVEIAARGVAAG